MSLGRSRLPACVRTRATRRRSTAADASLAQRSAGRVWQCVSLRICSAIACGRLLPAREDREGEEGHACGTCLGRVSDVPPDMLGGGGGGRAEVVEDESLGDGGECLEELCGEGARMRRQVWPRVRGLRGDQHEGGSTDLCAQESSEHCVNTREASTVSTADYGRLQLDTCVLSSASWITRIRN